ncbi:MAG: hypothetical protein NT037_16070 [Hyphomicrobiales bacterium]|nr:hypothetical protein [Hyphomicrobiales bacterium]
MIYDLEDLFAQADAAAGRSIFRRNPVTGDSWVQGLDSRAEQMDAAAAALSARRWFERERPAFAPELPVNYEEREKLKGTGRAIDYLIALYARSWEASGYSKHPRFAEFAAGALASDMLPDRVATDCELLRCYPPTPLEGLEGGCVWQMPEWP